MTHDANEADTSGEEHSSKAYTAPKGRPTRARGDTGERRRAFGPVAQWVTFTVAVLVVIIVVIMITGGGDFNPLNDDSTGAPSLEAPSLTT